MTIPPRHRALLRSRGVRLRGLVALAGLLLFYLVAGLDRVFPGLVG